MLNTQNFVRFARKTAIIITIGAAALTGCKKERAPGSKDPVRPSDVVAPPQSAVATDTNLSRGHVVPDVGSLTLKSKTGTLVFSDVNGSMVERPQSGTTFTELTVQAHKVPPDDHFKLRFARKDEGITEGNYNVDHPADNPDFALDAEYEHAGITYRAIGKDSHGMANLSQVTPTRAAGTYKVLLTSIDGKAAIEVEGSFNVRIQ